jgi:glycerophosphoryl diester phosphodiesterase
MPHSSTDSPHPFFDVSRPAVIGHRGAAGTHPENTLSAFAAALDQGAQILESDVHVTRDGVPILLHDPSVERVTEVRGDAADLDWAELSTFDAGYRFQDELGKTPYRESGITIPSVEEAFERFPDARFNLEIKCPDRPAIEAILDLVERFDRSGRTLLAAGEDGIMRDWREIASGHPASPAFGASVAEIVGAIGSALAGTPMPPGVMALQIPPDFGGNPLATPALIDHAHAQGVEVHVWTINDLEEIASLLDRGVDGIVTDLPGRMRDWLDGDGRR